TIKYGTAPGKYKYKTVVSKSRQLDHQAVLTSLEPDTTYYYKITADSSFYKKKKITSEMTFKTKPLAKKIPNGSLVKGSGYKVYVISGNEKLWIESADVFNKLGYGWDWIQTIDNVFLNEYKEGKSIKKTTSHSDGTLIKYSDSHAVYLIENRKKRPFSSAEVFIRKGYDWNRIITISKKEKYKTGEYL
ncbi:MAG: fibronectin type III domain-containing protein, partial [Candidatus Pacebacteria bacterium]|nr:fibronectin type III domain-containing protein [Candidatus Paceibacterota bacterium]